MSAQVTAALAARFERQHLASAPSSVQLLQQQQQQSTSHGSGASNNGDRAQPAMDVEAGGAQVDDDGDGDGDGDGDDAPMHRLMGQRWEAFADRLAEPVRNALAQQG